MYLDACTVWPYGRMCVAPYCTATVDFACWLTFVAGVQAG